MDDLPASSGPDTAHRSDTDPHGLSWPLVERRRVIGFPPFGIERRRARLESADTTNRLRPAPLLPFRIAALAVAATAVVRNYPDQQWHEFALLAVVTALTGYIAARPADNENTQQVRTRIVAEQFVNALAIVLSRSWASPFVLFLVPTGMFAGFAVGGAYSAIIGLTASVFISAPQIARDGWAHGWRDGALWSALLLLVAYTSGLVRRSVLEGQKARLSSDVRLAELTEANSLLASLQRLSHIVPASLDPDEVADGAVARLEAMIPFDHLAIYLVERERTRAVLTRARGRRPAEWFDLLHLPSSLRLANASVRPILMRELVTGSGIATGARSGVYATLRARGHDVGFLSVEADKPQQFTEQHTEVIHGVAQTLGVAIDNARLFQGIRTIAADQERNRIARNLHDQVGSSLALVGFEIDRALSVARAGGDVVADLEHAREQVSAVVTDMRETLYDLRTDTNDRDDLSATTTAFLARIASRSGLHTSCDIDLDPRLETTIEREVWQIVREAVLNAERHARARSISVKAHRSDRTVTVVVRDDGVGLAATTGRPDSYGITGMQERAARLRGALTVGRPVDGGPGTEVHFVWHEPSYHDATGSDPEEGTTT